jgi:hypothetical protein
MEKINTLEVNKIADSIELKYAILSLTRQKNQEWESVKKQLNISFEELKPLNIIKNEIKEFISSPTLKHDLINGAIGLTTGFLAKKLLVGKSNSALSSVFGIVTEFVVASKVSKNADYIKSVGSSILQHIFPVKEELENLDQ